VDEGVRERVLRKIFGLKGGKIDRRMEKNWAVTILMVFSR
jgi:hypothetical protein